MAVTVSRWGNSLGIRLPKETLERAHLREGDLSARGHRGVLVAR